jgi:hypothetical protein
MGGLADTDPHNPTLSKTALGVALTAGYTRRRPQARLEHIATFYQPKLPIATVDFDRFCPADEFSQLDFFSIFSIWTIDIGAILR